MSNFEALGRTSGGPSTVLDVTGEPRKITRPVNRGPGAAVTRRSNSEAATPAPLSSDPFRVVTNILREGDFSVTQDEVEAIRALKVDIAKFDSEIAHHSPDQVATRYKSTRFQSATSPLAELQSSARDLKLGAKLRKAQRVAQFAETALALVRRAILIVEGTAGLLEEGEKDRAAAYGVAFVPSHTLCEIERAPWFLREFESITKRNPDLLDVTVVLRLVAPFADA